MSEATSTARESRNRETGCFEAPVLCFRFHQAMQSHQWDDICAPLIAPSTPISPQLALAKRSRTARRRTWKSCWFRFTTWDLCSILSIHRPISSTPFSRRTPRKRPVIGSFTRVFWPCHNSVPSTTSVGLRICATSSLLKQPLAGLQRHVLSERWMRRSGNVRERCDFDVLFSLSYLNRAFLALPSPQRDSRVKDGPHA
jgi:hypothetical protein